MSILEKILPIPIGFHIIDMTNNPEYEVTEESKLDTNSADPLERKLAQKSEEDESEYKKQFGSELKKSKFKEETEVKKAQLSEKTGTTKKREKDNKEKEIVD